ncbi:HlyD family efflux transporter periplasmic adaptor subunit [Jannaschia sp. Os4]|uniref:efflux RND transporter periplasmic adaptor subunit n=1 Tax=Jannaschia sp. Os4 TaxID=2807617 RepID=UPI0019394C21|nr:HlyD family efflux transporter periplasmic adaptor subunit [Jannaschia sp. Os4]MBM2576073.1 HlyD family efflux transporter periplasmic adaptor subunit [Jannaschia sp. Os4]
MRFLGRSLSALFLAALTVGLLGWAVTITLAALEDRRARDAGGPPAREQVLAATVVTARPATVTPVLTAFGEVRARRVLELRAPVGGRVVELADGFEEGGAVEAGQVLLRIDPADAETALALARADAAGARAEAAEARRGVALAQAELDGARGQVALQEQALDRQRDLLARGVGAAAAVEAAELALSNVAQQVLAREQALAAAEARIDTADLAVERAGLAVAEAERGLADRTLRAEFDGVLSDVSVVRGGLLSPNEQVASLIDPSDLEVSFRLSVAQQARLLDGNGDLTGAPVRAVLDVLGLDVTAAGTVTREAAAVGEGQTGRLVFAALEGARGFRPGDFVRVEVEEPALERVVRLPASALSSQDTVLLVGAEERLEEAPVTVLRRQGDDVLVAADGLAGRDVVAARTAALGAGIRVRPVRPEGAAAPLPTTVALDPERRARLIAFVEGNDRMPPEVRDRLLARLQEPEVPIAVVERIEGRMGG